MEPAKAEVNGDVIIDTKNAQTLCLWAWSYIKTKGKQSKTKRVLQSLKQKNTSIMMTHMPSCHSLCSQNIIFPIKTYTGDPRAANQAAWLGGKTLLGFPRSLISNDSTAKQTEAEEPAGAPPQRSWLLSGLWVRELLRQVWVYEFWEWRVWWLFLYTHRITFVGLNKKLFQPHNG